jgi:glycosyltransferase involved in cell wall biosynthesis
VAVKLLSRVGSPELKYFESVFHPNGIFCMRIGIDATALYGRYGGVEYALWNLLVALEAVDTHNEYVVYVPHDGPPPANLSRFPVRWRWVRLPFAGADKARRVLWQQTLLPRQLLRDGCDILHAPTYVCPLRCPIPIVLTVYDFIALTHPQFATRLNRLHYGTMLPRSVRAAHRIIVPSDAVHRELSRRVPEAKSCACVVPLGVEPAFHEAPSREHCREVRERYHLPERFLLFVGNPEPKKNLPNLLRALDMLPRDQRFQVPLVVTGGARAWSGHTVGRTYESALQSTSDGVNGHLPGADGVQEDETTTWHSTQLQTATSLSSQTISLGYVPRRDLPVLYALCEAFVFPSLAEGFGLPVLEALSAGAAVVTSDRVPLPGLQQAALICNPYEPAAIAAAISRILSDEVVRASFGRRAHEFAMPYTWRRSAEMTLDVYHSLAQVSLG